MGKKSKNKQKQMQATQIVRENVDEVARSMVETFEFDVWWVLRKDKIPGHHMKEVIKADMMARGLSDKETLEDFDKALKAYGIN